MKSGVAQGNVLGPLFFLIYIKSLAENSGAKWYAFAENFKLYLSYRKWQNDVDSRRSLQNHVDVLSNTAASWNLVLNARKCFVMRFGCKYNEFQTGS